MTTTRTRLAAMLAAAVAATGCAAEQQPPARRLVVVQRPTGVQYYFVESGRTVPVVPARSAPPPAPPPAVYAPAPVPIPWGDRGIEARLDELGPRVRERWRPSFRAAGLGYPASSVLIVAYKREKKVEIYAGASPKNLRFVRRIPITAASGLPGPKLRQGDLQVPEGIYEVDGLNPNSAYHVSLHLDYPNRFDEEMATRDGRHNLGGQIMIHGNAKSIGCIAVGDAAAEDLFVLAADAGVGATKVVIVPRDFRRTRDAHSAYGQPSWVRDLYARLELELRALPPQKQPVVASSARPKSRSANTAAR